MCVCVWPAYRVGGLWTVKLHAFVLVHVAMLETHTVLGSVSQVCLGFGDTGEAVT